MSYTKRTLEELDVMDDFLMNQVAGDEDVGEAFCRRLLSTLLQREIGTLRIHTQKVISAAAPTLRGIRMDVEVEELGQVADGQKPAVMNIFDIEPHLGEDMDFPHHSRFYQAKIDSKGLKSGEKDFRKLPDLYVLTILNFDPFGYDQMVYTIRNKCEEVSGLDYEDGLRFYYFNVKGTKGGNPQIRTMLKYIADSRKENATDEATREVHDYVNHVKVLPEVKNAYMRFDTILYYERKEAAEEATTAATRATRQQDIFELLEEYGEVPEAVRKRIEEEENPDILKAWLMLAAKSGSMEEFVRRMDAAVSG